MLLRESPVPAALPWSKPRTGWGSSLLSVKLPQTQLHICSVPLCQPCPQAASLSQARGQGVGKPRELPWPLLPARPLKTAGTWSLGAVCPAPRHPQSKRVWERRQRVAGRVLQDKGVSKGVGIFGNTNTQRLELPKHGMKVNYPPQSGSASPAFPRARSVQGAAPCPGLIAAPGPCSEPALCPGSYCCSLTTSL